MNSSAGCAYKMQARAWHELMYRMTQGCRLLCRLACPNCFLPIAATATNSSTAIEHCMFLLASTPGPTEFVGPGSRCLILHGWSLGNAIAQKHHYDNAHKQLTVCCRSQELLLSTTSSCQHLFQMLGSLHGDGTDSAR